MEYVLKKKVLTDMNDFNEKLHAKQFADDEQFADA